MAKEEMWFTMSTEKVGGGSERSESVHCHGGSSRKDEKATNGVFFSDRSERPELVAHRYGRGHKPSDHHRPSFHR